MAGISASNIFLDEFVFNNNPYLTPFIKTCKDYNPGIKKVIFNDPATIVIWSDNTKTVVKCQEGDTYSKELGLAMCISKKYLGNKGNFNNEFKKWILEEPEVIVPVDKITEVMTRLTNVFSKKED